METAINNPREVEAIAIKTTPINVENQLIPDKSTINEVNSTGIKVLIVSKRIVSAIFTKTSFNEG